MDRVIVLPEEAARHFGCATVDLFELIRSKKLRGAQGLCYYRNTVPFFDLTKMEATRSEWDLSWVARQRELAIQAENEAAARTECEYQGIVANLRGILGVPPFSGWTYFIRCDEYVKIGYTGDVVERLGDLQVGNPRELKLAGKIASPCEFERGAHRQFADQRHRGEWFRCQGHLARFVDRLKEFCDQNCDQTGGRGGE